MSSITASNPISASSSLSKGWKYYAYLAKGYAGIIDSRESTYRTFLDLTGYCLPMTFAAAFRNIWNFLETGFETLFDAAAVLSAPHITKFSGFLSSKFLLNKEEQKDYLNYLNFQLTELEDNQGFEEGKKRIASAEVHDRTRISELYLNLNQADKAEHHLKKAEEIGRFANDLTYSDSLREKIYKLKRATIVTESFFEGIMFASEGLLTRMFRKYILRQDQFTGTLGYSSDNSGNFGGGGFSLFQKIGIGLSFIIAPAINLGLFFKTKDVNKVKESPNLKMINRELDMTHGVFPKLWLLFTYLMAPFMTGKIFTAQDKYELFDTMFKQCLLIPSWWFGHRVTNGLLARHSDKKLESEFGKRGILVEEDIYQKNPDDNWWEKLKKFCPEPTRIQHVLDKTEHNEEFKKEAVDLHAKTLYKGFGLHSFLIWVLMMGGNWVTKKWVTSGRS